MSRVRPELLAEVSEEFLMKHTKEIATWVRLSGSEEETKSLEYVKNILAEYGYDVREYRFDSFVGYPESAELTIPAPGRKKFTGSTPALAPPTPARGIQAEVIYVGKGDNYKNIDAKNKIVLIDGLSNPRLAKLSEEHGAVGQVFVNDDYVHEGIISVVWGTPTTETSFLLPKTPCMNINALDGDYLIHQLKKRKVRVTLKTRSWRGWKKVPVLTAELKGKEEEFVLFSGHIDSWYYGAMDNGSANATMLEVARIMAGHRDLLRRGLRLAFWSGHSHGRYSGSAWYADNLWEDLYEHCVAHVNIDSVGATGATLLSEAYVMVEAKDFASEIVGHVSRQKLTGRRFSRAGDQSFWGLGITAIFMSLSEQPLRPDSKAPSFIFGPHSGGLGWWWHTPEDTVDKIDPANLVRDTNVYLLTIEQLCSSVILPFDYSATVSEIEQKLRELQTQAQDKFELVSLIERAEKLKESIVKLNHQAVALNELIESGADIDANISAAKINEAIKKLGRLLIPINYSKVGSFDHDLATPIPAVPVLEGIADLPTLRPTSDEFRFLITRLKRESNKVTYAFHEAEKTIATALQDIER